MSRIKWTEILISTKIEKFDDNQLHEQFSFNVNIHVDLISFLIMNLGLDIII